MRHSSARCAPLDAPIADDEGGIGMPLLRLGMVPRLEHRGTITRAEAEACARFYALCQRASLR
jgi:hypothetical protein